MKTLFLVSIILLAPGDTSIRCPKDSNFMKIVHFWSKGKCSDKNDTWISFGAEFVGLRFDFVGMSKTRKLEESTYRGLCFPVDKSNEFVDIYEKTEARMDS